MWRLSRQQINMSPGWREQVFNTDGQRGGKSFYSLYPTPTMEHLASLFYRHRLDLRSCPMHTLELILRDQTKTPEQDSHCRVALSNRARRDLNNHVFSASLFYRKGSWVPVGIIANAFTLLTLCLLLFYVRLHFTLTKPCEAGNAVISILHEETEATEAEQLAQAGTQRNGDSKAGKSGSKVQPLNHCAKSPWPVVRVRTHSPSPPGLHPCSLILDLHPVC